MHEDMLHKAIYSLGSVKELAKQLGIHREHVYAWKSGVSQIPLEYALQIEYLTGGEIHWKDLVPFHIVQRLKHLTLLLPKFDLPPCELVYVAIERIKSLNSQAITQKLNDIPLNKKRPICLDSENTLIFGQETFYAYKYQAKKTIPAWRLSLLDLANGNYISELFVKNFFISERVAIGIALEKFLGNRQGYRSDLVKEKNKIIKGNSYPLEVSKNIALVNNDAQVPLKKRITMSGLIAHRLGFGSRFTYESAKLVNLIGSQDVITKVDQCQLSISKAARLSKCAYAEQNNSLPTSNIENIRKGINDNIQKRFA